MSDDLNIIVRSKIDQSTEAIKSLEEQIKFMSGKIKEAISIKLQIDASQLEILTKKVEETKKKIKTKSTTKDSLFINSEVEQQAFSEITARLREVKKNVDTLASVRTEYSLDERGRNKLETATLSYYNKELGQTVTETMRWVESEKEVNGEIQKRRTFRSVGLDVKDDMAKATRETEKLAQSLKNLELYKEKMLGGNGFLGEIDIFASKQKGRFDETALTKIRTEIEALNVNTPDLQNKIKQLGIQFSSLKQNASESGSVLTRALENAGKFLRFYLVGGLLVGFVSAIRKGIGAVIDLDSALTELNKVADLSSGQLESFTKRAYTAGVAIGRTGKEVINATAEFKRAGYELEEAFKLSQQALLLTNIGDGITDVKEASSSLISILKGFKMEASETSHIIDALNETSNLYAVDTNNLTEILKRASGTIAQTGTSYEQLLGLSVGAYESLRNSEMVASGINMISQRLRGMTEDGEKVEDLIPKIQGAFDKYTKGAVSVIDKQNGGLHSTFEILQQLNTVYGTLGEEAKAYLNEAISGNRQNKVLVAIMENWKNVEAATLSATNSLGSAERENEKYLNSINGKISQLTSNTQLFWKNLIDSNLIKDFVDILTSLVKTMDILVNNSFSSFIIQVATTSTAIILLSKGFNILKASIIGQNIAAFSTAVSLKGLNATIISLTKSMMASPLFGVVATTAVIYAIIEAVDVLTISLSEQKEIVTTLTTEIADLQSEYDKLNAIKNRNTDQEKYLQLLNQELKDKKELLKIEAQRAVEKEFFTPTTLKYKSDLGIDDSGQSTIKNSIKELKELQDKFNKADTYKNKKGIEEKILRIKTSLEDSRKTIQDYINKLGKDAPPALIELANVIDEVVLENNKLSKSANDVNNAVQSQFTNFQQLVKSILDTRDSVSEINSALNEYKENNKFSTDTLIKLIEKYPELLQYLNDEKTLYNELIKIQDDKVVSVENSLDIQLTSLKDNINDNLKLYNEDISNFTDAQKAKLFIASQLADKLTQINEIMLTAEYQNNPDAQYYWGRKLADLNTAKANISAQIDEYFSLKSIDIKKLITDVGKDKKSSSLPTLKDSIPTEDLTKEFIKSFNKAVDDSDVQIKHLERQLKINDEQKDYNKELEITNQLINAQETKLSQLEEANNKMLTEQARLIKENKLGLSEKTIESFFDTNGEASLDYKKYLDSFATKTQEIRDKTDKSNKKSIENTNKQIEALEKEKKQVEDLFNKIYALKKAWSGNTDEILKTKDAIDASRESIIKLNEDQQKNLSDVQKQLVEIIKKRYELEREEAEKAYKEKIELLDKELEAYKENIQEQIDEIDRLYEAENFEKNQQKATDEIAKLLNERNVLSMAAQSGDLTAINRIKEIDEELAKNREKLSDLQSDRERDLRKQNLKDSLDSKEKEIKSAKETEEEKYEIIKNNYEKLLEESNLYAEANKSLTSGMVTDINGKLVTVAEAFKTFSDRFGETLGVLGSNIQTEFIDKLNQAQRLINAMSGLPANTGISEVGKLNISNLNNNIPLNSNLLNILGKIDLSKISLPNFSIPKINLPNINFPKLSGAGGGDINISVPVNLSGGVDKSTGVDIGNTVAKIIRSELNKSGIYRK